MKIFTKIFLSLFILCCFNPQLQATHIVGGELSYECLGGQQYRITMKVYRDCFFGQASFDDPARIAIYTGSNGTTLFDNLLVDLDQIDNIPPVVSNPCLTPPSNVCVEVGLYQEVVTLPYDPDGYHFAYQRCCRNNTITNITNPQAAGATYTIYISDEAQQTCNNSPTFADFPPIVICVNEDINFDNSATDIEGDQIIYSFCAPFLGGSQATPVPATAAPPPYNQVNFVTPPYTAGAPLAGIPTVTIDPNTGLISGTPQNLGQFVVGICIEEYRNGQLLSITKRDFQFNVVDCVQTLLADIQEDITISDDEYVLNSCGDPTVTFVNQSTPSNLINSYYWEFDLNNGNVATSGLQNPTITFPGPDTYAGFLVVNPGNVSCTDTAEIFINIFPDIFADFDITFDPCSLDPIVFTDQTIADAGGVIYDWDFGDGSSSNDQNPTHIFAPGDYTITLDVEDVNGCTDQVSQNITYYPTPAMGFDISDPAGCAPHTVIFTNTSLPFTSDYDIFWTFGDGGTSSDLNPAYTYTTPGQYDVSLTITSPTGCVGTEVFQSIDIQLGPNIDFTNSDLCIEGLISFTDQTTPDGGPITSWDWDFGDSNGSSDQNPTHEYANPGTYTVSLTVDDVEGCSNDFVQTVDYYPVSDIDISVDDDAGCTPHTATFTNNSMPFTGTYDIAWDFGDGLGTSTAVNPTYTYTTPGTYTVTVVVTSPTGCTSQEVYTDMIFVQAGPTISFTTSDLCVAGPIMFTDQTVAGDGVLTNWNWTFGDGDVSTDQNPMHEYATPGTYDVSLNVIDEFGCNNTITQTIDYYPAPDVDIAITPPAGCTPLTVNFNNNSAPFTAGYTIEWDFGDGIGISPLFSPTYEYTTAGTYDVTITMTSPSGCTVQQVFPDAVFVQAGPDVSFTFSDPCTPGPISYTDNTIPGDGTITNWNWDFGDGVGTSTLQNPTYEFTAPGTYTVNLEIIDEFGCTNTVSEVIAYFPAPIIDIDYDDAGCTPHTVTFTNNSQPITPAFTVEWDFGDGIGTSTDVSPTYTYNTPGTYPVTLTITSPNGCVSQATLPSVFVQAGPTVAFTFSDPCVIGPISYTDNTTLGDGVITNWNWDFGDGVGTSTQQNPVYEFTTPGTYTITLEIIDANGCINTSSETIAYFPAPVIDIDYDEAGCTPHTVTFTNNSQPITPAFLVEWDFGDGIGTSTDVSPTYTYNTPGTYPVTVTITSPNGCSSQTTLPSVFVQAGPVVAFTYSDPCIPGPLSYTDGTTPGDGTLTNWNWDFGDGVGTSTQQNPSYEFAVPGTYTVTLEIIDQFGCTNTLSETIDYFPAPAISIDIDPASGCTPHTVTFTNNSQPLSPVYLVEWDFGDGFGTSTDVSPTYTYNQPGTYDVTVTITAPNGCTNQQVFSDAIFAQIGPNLAFSYSDLCVAGPLAFTDNTTIGDGTLSTWDWDFGDGVGTSTQQNPTYEYTTPGTYVVTLNITDTNGCDNSISETIDYFPAPVVDVTIDPPAGCTPHTVTFTNNSMPLTGVYTVAWDFGDGIGTSTDVSPVYTYTTAGTYDVTLTMTSPTGCTVQQVFPDAVFAQIGPNLAFSYSDLCVAGPLAFTDNTTIGDGTLSTWDWDFGDGVGTSTQQNPSYEYATPGTYTVTLNITDTNGCDNSISETIDYFPAPAVDVTIDPPAGCTPHTVTFTNNSLPLTGVYTVAWDFGDGIGTSTDVSPVYTYTTAGTYDVTLTMTSPTGCTVQQVFSDAVFAQIGPNLAFSYSDLCVAGPLAFTDNTTIGDGALSTWNWDFGDGVGTSTQQNPTYEYATPGTYTVTLNITDTNGCDNTISETIDYFPAPVVDVTIDPPAGCTPHTVTFTNNSLPLTGVYTVAWDFGDGIGTSTDVSPVYTYTTPGTYDVTLTMTSPTGCTVQQVFADAVFVQVGPNMAFIYSDLCIPGPISFTDQTTIGDGALSNWNWDFGDGAGTSTLQNPTYEYATPGTYIVTLNILDANGCDNTISETIDYFPASVIDIDIDPDTGCTPLTSTFTNNSTPYSSAYDISWDFGDTNTSTDENPMHTYTTPGTYSVTVSITSPTGCNSQQVYPDAVFVQAGSAVGFTYDFDSCSYDPIQFIDQSIPGDSPIAGWEWDFGDGNTSTLQNPIHTYADIGSYDVTLTVPDASGCANSITQTINWFPAPVIDIVPDNVQGCQPLSVTFANNSYPLIGYTTVWDLGDGNTSTDASPVHNYPYAGTYDVSVTITSPTNCEETAFFPALIQVDSVPEVNFAPSGGTCLFGPVQFEDLTPDNGAPMASWDWDFGDGNTSNLQNPIYEYTTSNSYDVTLTVTAQNGCANTITQTINWEFIPDIIVEPSDVRGCIPHTVTFDNLSDPIPNWTAIWDFGDGNSSTDISPTHTYPYSGTYDVMLTMESPFGCVIDTLYVSYIQVDTIPTAGFDFEFSCEDEAVVFTDTSTPNGSPVVSWFWDFGDATTSTLQNPLHAFPPVAGMYDVTLTVTDDNGCIDSIMQQVDWFPPAVVNFEADDDFGCAPHTVTFINNSVPLDPGYEMFWDLGNGETSTELEPVTTYDTGVYTVSLQITAPTGCVTELVLNNYIRVTDPPIADFTFTPPNPTNLDPEVSFSENAQNETEWYWDFGNGDSSQQPNPTYAYPDTGIYNVTLYVSQPSGCTDSITQVIDVAPVFTYFLPNAFTPNFDDTNDGFKGAGITWTLRQFEMTIFNRWGEMVFQTNDPNEAWNGRKNNSGQMSPNGVYVYLVTLTEGRGKMHEYKGYATLIR